MADSGRSRLPNRVAQFALSLKFKQEEIVHKVYLSEKLWISKTQPLLGLSGHSKYYGCMRYQTNLPALVRFASLSKCIACAYTRSESVWSFLKHVAQT